MSDLSSSETKREREIFTGNIRRPFRSFKEEGRETRLLLHSIENSRSINVLPLPLPSCTYNLTLPMKILDFLNRDII